MYTKVLQGSEPDRSFVRIRIRHKNLEEFPTNFCRVGHSHICTIAHSTFSILSKERLCDRLFKRAIVRLLSFKRAIVQAIAQSLFWKEELCDRPHNRSFEKRNWVIARTIALLKRGIVWSPAQSLFWKEELCDRPHNRSFEKSDKKAILQLFFSKEQLCKNVWRSAIFQIAHFCPLKRVIAHFQTSLMMMS